jgi:hypothetical protein
MIWSLIINKVFSPIGKMVSAVTGVLFAIWYIYQKGKTQATIELQNKSFKEARNAIKKANDARLKSAVDSDRGGLLEDDGFKRD